MKDIKDIIKMDVQELQETLNQIRTRALIIIKDVMSNAGISELNLNEIDCATANPLTHQDFALASISTDSEGHLVFESDGEFDTISDGEDDLSTDVLVEIARWMMDNEDDIIGEEEYPEEEEW